LKITNTNYKSLSDLYKNLDLSNLDPNKTFIQIFTGLITEPEIKYIQSVLREKNSAITFIGSTTAGEINNGEVKENSILISIMEFKNTTFKQAYFVDENDYNLGVEIASSLFTDNTKAMILFIDGIHTNGNDVVDGISSLNSAIPLAGGMAGDNGAFVETFVFDNNGVYNKGAVAVSLNSDLLNVFTDYQLNWQAIGQEMLVTKAEKNRLYEIDGMSASEIYRKYLGDKVGDNLPFSATEFPLLKIEEDGLEVCRTFIHQFEEDGSLLTIGNLEVGDKVRLAFGNIDLILNSSKNNLSKYQNFQPEAIFTYSCTARRAFLQSQVVVELKPLSNIAPSCGFFTYGEIFHKNNKNSFLNISLTVFALSEADITEEKSKEPLKNSNEYEKNFITNKRFLVLDALTHLSNTVIKELEETQDKLKDLASRDYLTELYNRRYFNEVSQGILEVAQREKKECSVVMIDIDNFKNINDTYGHSVGDRIIKELAHILIENTRDSDIVSRFGGEEFALLFPLTTVDGAFTIAEKLRTAIENKEITIDNNKHINFTISIGIDRIDYSDKNTLDKALDRADKALYKAKETGRNKTVIFE
jgi:diguanylate cyclase (GGDEF)-like protein